RVGLTALKYVMRPDVLVRLRESLGLLHSADGLQFFVCLAHYLLCAAPEVTSRALAAVAADALGKEGEATVLTEADRLMQKGRKKGRQEGRQEGRQKG